MFLEQYPSGQGTPRPINSRSVENWDSDELSLDFGRGKIVRLTHLAKTWFPDTGTTKKNVLSYYRKIATTLLPHLAGRPLTLKRYPDGVGAEFFYEKRYPSHKPAWIKTARLRDIDFVEVSTLPELLWVVNLASIELHPYLMSANRDLEHPLAMVFDLDPGPGAGIEACAKVALRVRFALAQEGLESFAKTSGSKGLQVYVPLNPRRGQGATFVETKAYARSLAESLERNAPKLVVSRMAKNLRVGKVLIDWSQNDQAKTTVAPYSMRATSEPRISTPLRWEEVKRAAAGGGPSLHFGPKEVLARVDEYGDLFEPVLKLRQNLPF